MCDPYLSALEVSFLRWGAIPLPLHKLNLMGFLWFAWGTKISTEDSIVTMRETTWESMNISVECPHGVSKKPADSYIYIFISPSSSNGLCYDKVHCVVRCVHFQFWIAGFLNLFPHLDPMICPQCSNIHLPSTPHRVLGRTQSIILLS